MKSIRKYFNWPNVLESAIIEADCVKMREMAKELSIKHSKDQNAKKLNLDNTCPKCKATDVVNKIANVEGSGYVSGSFSLGSGYVSGSSYIDSSEVNHCSKCGNQWKKYKIDWEGKDDIMAGWLDSIMWFFEDGLRLSVFDNLKEFHAESIWKIRNEVFDECLMSTQSNLDLSTLRTKFKSVYDK